VLRVIQASAGMGAPSAPLIEVGEPAELEVVADVLTEDAVTAWESPDVLAAPSSAVFRRP
jgi:hypothetical protein